MIIVNNIRNVWKLPSFSGRRKYWDNKMATIYYAVLLSLTIILFMTAESLAQINDVSSLNSSCGDTNYSFVVGGHYYGNASNQTGFPANTVMANMDIFNSVDNAFHVIVGDVFLDVKNDFPLYQKKFFKQLKRPVFIAVGNHDVSGSYFGENIGETCVQFKYGNDMHVVLDTEKDDGSILNNQLSILKTACNSNSANIFIYTHRPVWSEENMEMQDVFKHNSKSDFGVNFKKEVLPILEGVDDGTQVYWISGSLGGSAPASYFYHRTGNLHFIQTAIRGLKRDGILGVKSIEGKITFNPISLTDQNLDQLESYNLLFWCTSHPKVEFNPRLIKMYLTNIAFHRYFWYGFVAAVVIMCLFIIFIKRRKSKINNG